MILGYTKLGISIKVEILLEQNSKIISTLKMDLIYVSQFKKKVH